MSLPFCRAGDIALGKSKRSVSQPWETSAGESHTDKVAILEIEAIQLIASCFCVHDVLINDKSGAFGVVGNSLADLAGGTLAHSTTRNQANHLPGSREEKRRWRKDIPHRAELPKEIKELFRSDVVAV